MNTTDGHTPLGVEETDAEPTDTTGKTSRRSSISVASRGSPTTTRS